MKVLDYSQTHPTRCKYCKGAVFFHTNGHGDAVFFDDLGPPWPVHSCYFAYQEGRLAESYQAYRARMVTEYGTVDRSAPRQGRPLRTVGWTHRSSPKRRDPRQGIVKPPRPEDIVRCDPANCRAGMITVSGILREIHPHRELKGHFPGGSAGYAAMLNALGSDSYTQITVIDRDLLSYTSWIPIAEISVPLGTPVRVSVERVRMLDDCRFICRGLERVQL
ncbi:MAG: hypothetical protein ACREOQ_23215 [Gemmatimonadales bacterium]